MLRRAFWQANKLGLERGSVADLVNVSAETLVCRRRLSEASSFPQYLANLFVVIFQITFGINLVFKSKYVVDLVTI